MSRARPLLLVIFTSVGFGVVNTALVWVFVHQLGYLWRDGMLDSPGRRWALAAAGLTVRVPETAHAGRDLLVPRQREPGMIRRWRCD